MSGHDLSGRDAVGSTAAAGTRRRHAILSARTRRLARPRLQADPPPTVLCLVCEADGELYALPAARVARVTPESVTSFTPSRSAQLAGIAVVAGAIHHIVDLRVAAGKARAQDEGHFVQLRGAGVQTALRVDRAEDVLDLIMLSADEVSGAAPTHAAVTGFARALNANKFSGRTIALLDPDHLAPSPVQTSGRTTEGD